MSDTSFVDSAAFSTGDAYIVLLSDAQIIERAFRAENAKLKEHVRNLLPYAYMLMREEKPLAAYADLLPYVIADAEAASKKETT